MEQVEETTWHRLRRHLPWTVPTWQHYWVPNQFVPAQLTCLPVPLWCGEAGACLSIGLNPLGVAKNYLDSTIETLPSPARNLCQELCWLNWG